MAKARLGVIGAGSWAVASHLPNFEQRREEVEFVGVCRKGEELLERIKDAHGFEVASEDYRDVLAAGVDICLVASPTALHHQHAKAALEAGAHVLLEKPFTVDPAQAWDLVETAKRVDRQIVVSFGWNYRPMVVDAKRLMEEHGIGEVEQVMIHMASATRELLSNTGSYALASDLAVPEQSTWTDPAVSGGGYGQAQLSHALGLSLWLTGLRGQEAFALMSAPLDAPVELHDAVALRFDNGAIGTMAGGSTHSRPGGNENQLEVRIIGSEGQFHIDLEREIVWLYRTDGTDIRLDLEPDAGRYDCDGPPHVLVDLGVGKPAQVRSPGELGARTVEVLDAVYRSAQSGQLEQIELT